jgi:uncharacterized protein with von Willebrand factor type A (vWA) domain
VARSTRARPPRVALPAPLGAAARLGARSDHWIETDRYDRATFERLHAESTALGDLLDSGTKLLPHFRGFVLDLFAILFKLNVVWLPSDAVRPSAGFYRLVLTHICANPALAALRTHTAMDETRAGLATLLLAEQLLALLKSERVVSRAEMLDFWSLDQQENEIAGVEALTDTAVDLHGHAGSAPQRQLAELAQRLRREQDSGARRLAHRARRIIDRASDSVERNRLRVDAATADVLRSVDQVTGDVESWTEEFGEGRRLSASAQIELGRQLARNPKLKKLADLVGRMRTQAAALRRKVFERASAEMYDVGLGADLSHLLPCELLARQHPILRRDFARRFVERQLLEYRLRTAAERGRGPLVVCIDGSSSMAGDKEIWAKAVALTLLQIAQRQRRRFRSICFAAADTPLHILDLNAHQPYSADQRYVFQLAEYFPGGGTDFQVPLSAAVACLRQSRFRHGDVVLITDGECRVDPAWAEQFRQAKAQLDFALFSVLIDVGSHTLGPLRTLSDRVTTVTQLTSDASRDVFLTL